MRTARSGSAPWQFDRLAKGADQGFPRPFEGRHGHRRRAGGGVDPPLAARRTLTAALGTLRAIGLDRTLGTRPRSPPRPRHRHDREPTDRAWGSKLATARGLDPATAVSSLGEALGLGAVDEDELYHALQLALRPAAEFEEPGQEAPRRRRAGPLRRHLDVTRGALLLWGEARLQPRRARRASWTPLTASSWCRRLAARWWSRFDGDTGDPKTLSAQIAKVKQRFGSDERGASSATAA